LRTEDILALLEETKVARFHGRIGFIVLVLKVIKGDGGPKAHGEENLPDISIEKGIFGKDGQFRGVLWEITGFFDRIKDSVPVILGDISVHAHFLKGEKGLGDKVRDDARREAFGNFVFGSNSKASNGRDME
jgi:hypothetical protein